MINYNLVNLLIKQISINQIFIKKINLLFKKTMTYKLNQIKVYFKIGTLERENYLMISLEIYNHISLTNGKHCSIIKAMIRFKYIIKIYQPLN